MNQFHNFISVTQKCLWQWQQDGSFLYKILWIVKEVSFDDGNNSRNTELKTLIYLNFSIVVNTQTTFLLRKTQPNKTDYSRQNDKQLRNKYKAEKSDNDCSSLGPAKPKCNQIMLRLWLRKKS